MADDASSGGAAPPLDKAADRIRETSKWLIATFAAVGGALIAGSQLSSIGSLAPANWMRFAIAAAGVLIAILGVAWAIAAAVRVSVAGSVNLAGLAALPQGDAVRTRLEEDEALMAGYRSLGALATDYAEAVARRKQTYDAYIADRSQPVSDPSKLEDAKTAAANATFLSQTVQNVLSVGSFEAVATEFKKSRRDLFVGAAAAAAGILAFAAAANPADKGQQVQ
jgi:hypothetical protein